MRIAGISPNYGLNCRPANFKQKQNVSFGKFPDDPVKKDKTERFILKQLLEDKYTGSAAGSIKLTADAEKSEHFEFYVKDEKLYAKQIKSFDFKEADEYLRSWATGTCHWDPDKGEEEPISDDPITLGALIAFIDDSEEMETEYQNDPERVEKLLEEEKRFKEAEEEMRRKEAEEGSGYNDDGWGPDGYDHNEDVWHGWGDF